MVGVLEYAVSVDIASEGVIGTPASYGGLGGNGSRGGNLPVILAKGGEIVWGKFGKKIWIYRRPGLPSRYGHESDKLNKINQRTRLR